MERQYYRPLIRLYKQPRANLYLPFDYIYSLTDIATMKKHMPKLLNLVGVDAEQYAQSNQSECQQYKLKLKAIRGLSIIDDEPIRIYKQGEIQVAEWKEVCLCVDLPFNSKHNQKTAREALDLKLQQYLDKHFYLLDKKTNDVMNQKCMKQLNLSDVDLFLEPSEVKAEPFDKQHRQLRLKLPISIIVSKAEILTVQKLKEYLKTDILNSVKIMIKNNMTIRVLQTRPNVFLQSFVKETMEEEGQLKNLNNLLNQTQDNGSKKVRGKEIEEAAAIEARRDPSNRSLIMIVVGLGMIYIFLKMYPLKQMLDL